MYSHPSTTTSNPRRLASFSEDPLMNQIQQKYLEGHFDECMTLIDKRFSTLRTHFQSPPTHSDVTSSRLLHSCNRNAECDCSALSSFLLAIAFNREETDVTAFLQASAFLHEAELRMPFQPFTEWIQLEIYRGNHDKADEMLRRYIYESTRMKTDSDSDQGGDQGVQDTYRGMFGGMRRTGFGMMGSSSFGANTRDLPLSKEEYYELLELLVFYILIPSKGFEGALLELNKLPMTKDMKKLFKKRLTEIRNTAIADLKITNHESINTSPYNNNNTVPSTQASTPKRQHQQQKVSHEEEKGGHSIDSEMRTNKGQKKDKSKIVAGWIGKWVTKERIKKVMIYGSLLVLMVTLIRIGIQRRHQIITSWPVRMLLLFFFNYKMGSTPTQQQ